MAVQPDINFNIQTTSLLPVRKRKTNYFALFDILTYPLLWLNNMGASIYLRGGYSTANLWSSSTTYASGDRVVGSDNAVYESLVNSNTNHNPTTTTGYWYKIEDTYVGVQQRVKYNAQILTFEYALNQWFNTTFRQPPSLLDIYIQTNAVVPKVFIVAPDEAHSSFVTPYEYQAVSWVMNSYSVSVQYDYTIYVPIAVWTALGSNATDRNNTIKRFADKYNLAGLIYNIQTY